MYKLVRASDDDPLLGGFYGSEISGVKPGDVFAIEKIIKLDKRRGSAFVSWKGYGPEFNSYVPLDDIKSYQELLDGSTSIDSNDNDTGDGGHTGDNGSLPTPSPSPTDQRVGDGADDQSIPTQ